MEQHNVEMASSDNVVLGAEVCLVSQIPSPTNVSAEAEIPARSYNKPALITVQRNMCVCVCVHTCTHAHARTCMCVCVTVRKEVPLGIGCSTGEDKVGWCLLTWPMIHNWGRTAVAGCTDRSQGWWQMIGPCGAKLSLTLGELFQMFTVRYLLTCPSWACHVYVNQAVTDPQSVWPHLMSQCKWTQYYKHLHN